MPGNEVKKILIDIPVFQRVKSRQFYVANGFKANQTADLRELVQKWSKKGEERQQTSNISLTWGK